MENPLPSLATLPYDVLENIADDLGVFGIRSLRAVCKRLRDFVDSTPLDARIDQLRVAIKIKAVIVQWSSSGRRVETEYSQCGETCYVSSQEGRQVFRGHWNGHFGDMFLRHFELLFINNKIAMEKLEVSFEHFEKTHPITEKLATLLSNGAHKMKTEHVELNLCNPDEVFAVLTHVSPEVLETIGLDKYHQSFRKLVLSEMDMDRLVNLAQWKQAKNTIFSSPSKIWLSSSASFRHFRSYDHLCLNFKTVHLEDILFIKEMMTQENAILRGCHIYYHKFPEEKQFWKILGPEDRTLKDGYEWHVKISDDHGILLIDVPEQTNHINFCRRSDIQ